MTTYRIVCTEQEPASQPPQHGIISKIRGRQVNRIAPA